MTDLGTVFGTFSEARGINPAGQIVGYSSVTSDNEFGEIHATLWTPK